LRGKKRKWQKLVAGTWKLTEDSWFGKADKPLMKVFAYSSTVIINIFYGADKLIFQIWMLKFLGLPDPDS